MAIFSSERTAQKNIRRWHTKASSKHECLLLWRPCQHCWNYLIFLTRLGSLSHTQHIEDTQLCIYIWSDLGRPFQQAKNCVSLLHPCYFELDTAHEWSQTSLLEGAQHDRHNCLNFWFTEVECFQFHGKTLPLRGCKNAEETDRHLFLGVTEAKRSANRIHLLLLGPFLSPSISGVCPIELTLRLSGSKQLQREPSFARRFTHPGIEDPVNRVETSLQKWLQFFTIRWYVSPLYSLAIRAMKSLKSLGLSWMVPSWIVLRNLNPGQLRGSTSKTPLEGQSCAPNAYSIPWASTAEW